MRANLVVCLVAAASYAAALPTMTAGARRSLIAAVPRPAVERSSIEPLPLVAGQQESRALLARFLRTVGLVATGAKERRSSFDVDARSLGPSNDLAGALDALEASGRGAPAVGVIGPDPERFAILTLRDNQAMARRAPEAPEAWRRLDVAVLHELLLDPLLERDPLEREEAIVYTRDADEAADPRRTRP